MKVSVVSRSGREIVKGGIQLSDSVSVWNLIELLFLSHFPSRFLEKKKGREEYETLSLMEIFVLFFAGFGG